MSEHGIRETLQKLAHQVVRNEIVCEELLGSLGISRQDFNDKMNEKDNQLKTNSEWQRRFPELFPDA